MSEVCIWQQTFFVAFYSLHCINWCLLGLFGPVACIEYVGSALSYTSHAVWSLVSNLKLYMELT